MHFTRGGKYNDPFGAEVHAVAEDHHGREYVIGAIGAVAEYLAVRYGMDWLAWLAMFLMWLAVVEYTRRWAKGKVWLYASWAALFLVMAMATYFLIKPKSVVANPPIPPPPQPALPSKEPIVPPAASTETNKTQRTPQDSKKSQRTQPPPDNSVHVDNSSTLQQRSNGDCSPNIVGGANTVNCSAPQRVLTEDQKKSFREIMNTLPDGIFLAVESVGTDEAAGYSKQFYDEIPTKHRAQWSRHILPPTAMEQGVWLQINQDDEVTARELIRKLRVNGIGIDTRPALAPGNYSQKGRIELWIGTP
jgi:hypothetical protein